MSTADAAAVFPKFHFANVFARNHNIRLFTAHYNLRFRTVEQASKKRQSHFSKIAPSAPETHHAATKITPSRAISHMTRAPSNHRTPSADCDLSDKGASPHLQQYRMTPRTTTPSRLHSGKTHYPANHRKPALKQHGSRKPPTTPSSAALPAREQPSSAGRRPAGSTGRPPQCLAKVHRMYRP